MRLSVSGMSLRPLKETLCPESLILVQASVVFFCQRLKCLKLEDGVSLKQYSWPASLVA